METTRFFREGRIPTTIDVTKQLRGLDPQHLSGNRLVLPFISHPGYPGMLAEDDIALDEYGQPLDFLKTRRLEVGFERYSLSQVVEDWVKSQKWGENQIDFYERNMFTFTFLAPNTMRIV